MKARHSQEAKGLLVMIRYLKVRISREAAFRGDLAYQKEYLSALISEKQSTYVPFQLKYRAIALTLRFLQN